MKYALVVKVAFWETFTRRLSGDEPKKSSSPLTNAQSEENHGEGSGLLLFLFPPESDSHWLSGSNELLDTSMVSRFNLKYFYLLKYNITITTVIYFLHICFGFEVQFLFRKWAIMNHPRHIFLLFFKIITYPYLYWAQTKKKDENERCY